MDINFRFDAKLLLQVSFTLAMKVDASHVMRMAGRTREDEQGKGWMGIIFNDPKYKEFTCTSRGRPVKFISTANYKPQIQDRRDWFETEAMKWVHFLLFALFKFTLHTRKMCFSALFAVQRQQQQAQ